MKIGKVIKIDEKSLYRNLIKDSVKLSSSLFTHDSKVKREDTSTLITT